MDWITVFVETFKIVPDGDVELRTLIELGTGITLAFHHEHLNEIIDFLKGIRREANMRNDRALYIRTGFAICCLAKMPEVPPEVNQFQHAFMALDELSIATTNSPNDENIRVRYQEQTERTGKMLAILIGKEAVEDFAGEQFGELIDP